MTAPEPDPLNLAHRIHVHLTNDGYHASCTCGWRTTRRTRELRQHDIDAHQPVTGGD